MKTVFQGVLLFAALLIPLGVAAQMEPPMHSFFRADANTDGGGDLSDAVYIFEWLFLGAETWQEPTSRHLRWASIACAPRR